MSKSSRDLKDKKFFDYFNDIRDSIRSKQIGIGAGWLYIIIQQNISLRKSTSCTLTDAALAKELGASTSSIQNWLKELNKESFISYETRYNTINGELYNRRYITLSPR